MFFFRPSATANNPPQHRQYIFGTAQQPSRDAPAPPKNHYGMEGPLSRHIYNYNSKLDYDGVSNLKCHVNFYL